MNRTVEIYFKDLIQDAKERLLQQCQTTEDQENWDTIPLAVIERKVDEPYP